MDAIKTGIAESFCSEQFDRNYHNTEQKSSSVLKINKNIIGQLHTVRAPNFNSNLSSLTS